MSETDPLLSADGLWRSYRAKTARQTDSVEAVKDVSLQLAKSGSLAVVGRSGSGKSTLARLLLAIENPDRGTVRFMGRQLSHRPEREIRGLRRNLQAVFQDPGSSLNPCLRVGTIVAEPLAAHGIGSFDERRYRVREVLDQVGLDSGAELKYPDQFSGGERQRIAIARAMAPEPELVLLDEPVSSLDASVQRDVIALLRDLRRRYGLTILMISHDLDVVRDLCERVAVMHEGCFVETGPTEKILSSPEHPATRELVEAAGTHR